MANSRLKKKETALSAPRGDWEKKLSDREKEIYRTPQQLRVRKAVLWHLNEIDIVMDAAKNGKADDRRRAAELLGEIGSRGLGREQEKMIVSTLLGMLDDPWDIKVSYAAVKAMKELVSHGIRNELSAAVPKLQDESLDHPDVVMRFKLKELLAISR